MLALSKTSHQTYPVIDEMSSLLSIDAKEEMIKQISHNIPLLNSSLTIVEEELQVNESELLKSQALFIQTLKFIDTLNLFIPDASLKRLMSQISNITRLINRSEVLLSKSFLLKHIRYTEISLIFVNKSELFELCFIKGNQLALTLHSLIDSVRTCFRQCDCSLFKQIQNIFYIVNNRLEGCERKSIQLKINEFKEKQKSTCNYLIPTNDYKKSYSGKNKVNTTQAIVRLRRKIKTKHSPQFRLTKNSLNPKEEEKENHIQSAGICIHSNDKNKTNKFNAPVLNRFQESLRSLDPKLLLRIKEKLNETNSPLYLIHPSFDMFFESVLSNYQIRNKKISLEQPDNPYLSEEPLLAFLFFSKNAAIHREYIILKLNEYENPTVIGSNIIDFEEQVLLPLYWKITTAVNESKKHYRKVKNFYKKAIAKILSKESQSKFYIKPYGSLINNFQLENGDIDLCIITDLSISEFTPLFIQIVNQLKTKDDTCSLTQSLIVKNALLLTLVDIQSDISIDVSVHNVNPERNSNMIRFYSIYDQRFHIMGLYVKNWAKTNKAHGTSQGYLSSYALLLLLISFLQKVEPPVLPFFNELEERIEYHLENNVRDRGKMNRESVGQLLVGFFEYYSYFYDHNYKIVIGSNEEVMNASDTAFSIVEPFDADNDPGRSMKIHSDEYNRFISLMKREINYIMTREYVNRVSLNQSPKHQLVSNTI